MKKKLIAGIAAIALFSTATATTFAYNETAGAGAGNRFGGDLESRIERVEDLVDDGLISRTDADTVITAMEDHSEECTGEGSTLNGILKDYIEGSALGAQYKGGNAQGEGSGTGTGNRYGGSNGTQAKVQDGSCLEE